MLDDVDRTIEELLRRELPPAMQEQVQISFAAPDDQFPPPTVATPAIDLFLYDVRENRDLRAVEWTVERQANGAAAKRPPPARVDCSYLVTVWPGKASTTPVLDEHRLLGEVMKVLLRFPTLPPEVLKGALAGQEPDLPTAALRAGNLQNISEFWESLRGKARAALTYTVTIGVQVQAPRDAGSLVIDTHVDVDPK